MVADVRVIAATNRNLAAMVQEGRFREDLFFRLNVLPVQVPSLRERAEDVPLLATHFSRRYCQRNNRRAPTFHPDALQIMKAHRWPGNIRELHNLVERLIIMCDGPVIGPADLPELTKSVPGSDDIVIPGSQTLAAVREDAERTYIRCCLAAAGGNVTRAAALLGVERSNLHKKMKALGIGPS